MHAYATSTPYLINASSTRTAAARQRSALAAHMQLCNVTRGPMFALYCTVESLNAFLLPRIVTVLFATAIMLGAGALAL